MHWVYFLLSSKNSWNPSLAHDLSEEHTSMLDMLDDKLFNENCLMSTEHFPYVLFCMLDGCLATNAQGLEFSW